MLCCVDTGSNCYLDNSDVLQEGTKEHNEGIMHDIDHSNKPAPILANAVVMHFLREIGSAWSSSNLLSCSGEEPTGQQWTRYN